MAIRKQSVQRDFLKILDSKLMVRLNWFNANKWKSLKKEFIQTDNYWRALEIIATMNHILSEAFDMKGLGGDITFEEFLHTYIRLTLQTAKTSNNKTTTLLKRQYDKPYEALDHFEQARFQYDARHFIKIQGIIVPREEKLLDNKKARILYAGNHILLIEKEETETKVTLLFTLNIFAKLIIPKTIAGYTITELAGYVFYAQNNIIELWIPDSIKKIGEKACAHCLNLVSLVRYKTTLFKGKRKNDWDYNTRKTLINWDSNIVVDNDAFKECCDLVSYPEGFKECCNLVSYPEGFKLEEATESKDEREPILQIKYGEYKGCDNIKDFPNPELNSDVTHLTKIGVYAFKDSTLEICDLSKTKVMRLEAATFSRCEKLKEVILPLTLRYISPTAFHYCPNLTKIHFPDDVATNGFFVIENNLIFTGGGRTLIRGLQPPKLETKKLKNEELKNEKSKTEKSKTEESKTEESKTEELKNEKLKNEKLKNEESKTEESKTEESKVKNFDVFLSSKPVVNIVGNTFPELKTEESKTEESEVKEIITIPDGVTHLGESFLNKSFKNITLRLPSSLISIGQSAFKGATNITFEVDDANPSYTTESRKNNPNGNNESREDNPNGNNLYYAIGNKVLLYASVPNQEPNTLSLKGVTKVKAAAFTGSPSNIEFIANVGSLSRIDNYAFESLDDSPSPSALKLFPMNDAQNLDFIGKYAFNNCEKLEFASKSEVLTFPNSIRIIGRKAFKNCKKIEKVIIGKNIRALGANCFDGCENLEEVDFSKAKDFKIGNDIFANCEKIKKVTLNERQKDLEAALKEQLREKLSSGNVKIEKCKYSFLTACFVRIKKSIKSAKKSI